MFGIILSILVLVFVVSAGYIFDFINKEPGVTKSGVTKVTTPLGIFLAIVLLLFQSYTVVSAGHVGVQVTLGEVNPVVLKEGLHFVNPISRVRDVDVRLQRANLQGSQAGTKDLQQVHTDIVINYRLSAEKVPQIYKNFGLDVDDKVLGPSVNEAFKAVTAHYNSEELITKRDEVSNSILEHVRLKVAQYDVDVNSVSLVNFGFSADYQKAVEAKVIATQQKQKAEQDLQRIQVEAQQAVARAEGEAKAIQIQAQAIQTQGGAAYVNLKAIEKWDGKLPQYNGGGVVPFVNLGK